VQTHTPAQDPWSALGIGLDAGNEQIRAAYLAGVKRHPPDRDPEAFERIRDAYECIRDPGRRISRMLLQVDPTAPLVSLLDGTPPPRRFVPVEKWIDALKEA